MVWTRHILLDILLERRGIWSVPEISCWRGGAYGLDQRYPARHCKHVHVKSDLALEPGAACTCSHKPDSPGSVARHCKLVHVKSDRACSPGSVARYCKLVHVRSDLASEPGAANACSL